MSQQLISRNSDLKELRDQGYEVRVFEGLLIIDNVPYVNQDKVIRKGSLISELTLSGNGTSRPKCHVVNFTGKNPCDKYGKLLNSIIISSNNLVLAPGLSSQHQFSSKPSCGYYDDYFHKMTTYANILSGHAKHIDKNSDAKTFRPVKQTDENATFKYADTATSRAGIYRAAKKLENLKVAIIGLGGTGSHIMDAIAKSPVAQIHMFDDDWFYLHNAYRSAGVPTTEELENPMKKVHYFYQRYSSMRNGLIAHDYHVTKENVTELQSMDFVFISIDNASAKLVIFRVLEDLGIPFIDVGMGLHLSDDNASIGGVLRVTTSCDNNREHVKHTVNFSEDDGEHVYTQNIQIAELNSLNASLAVIRFKKLFGFYQDFDYEFSSTYTLDGNLLLNGDKE